jgi:hypothetical protein
LNSAADSFSLFSCVFCKEDRALRDDEYDAQITAHLFWHTKPQESSIEDSWKMASRDQVGRRLTGSRFFG